MRLDVAIARESAEALSSVMLSLSPSGILVSEEGAIVTLTIYLPDPSSLEDAQAAIKNALDRIGSQGLNTEPGRITISSITDKDWVENYKRHFKLLRIGRFLIKPSWKDVEVAGDNMVIQLDPGLAFGTGSHPTTEGCLLFLQEFLRGGEVVFDLGTGSGILAIAAAKLGAKRVIAVDNDEMAVTVAQENARVNGTSSIIDFRYADFADIGPVDVDLLVANLTTPVIINVLPDVVKKLRGLKVFIASGITTGQEDKILAALKENGFEVVKVIIKDGWVTVVSTFG
ncbi:MAG TPA: 50S ribosomal protein L11 methyltransferase [Anaerolineae bacterium]|nr:50S ribosomal protein L11 methyltransferase [Anaerolineae bacterium]